MRVALSEMGAVRLALCAFGCIVWQGERFWEGEAREPGGRVYPGSDGASPYRAAWIQSVSRMVRVSTRLWVATLFRMTIASPSLISTSSGIVTL